MSSNLAEPDVGASSLLIQPSSKRKRKQSAPVRRQLRQVEKLSQPDTSLAASTSLKPIPPSSELECNFTIVPDDYDSGDDAHRTVAVTRRKSKKRNKPNTENKQVSFGFSPQDDGIDIGVFNIISKVSVSRHASEMTLLLGNDIYMDEGSALENVQIDAQKAIFAYAGVQLDESKYHILESIQVLISAKKLEVYCDQWTDTSDTRQLHRLVIRLRKSILSNTSEEAFDRAMLESASTTTLTKARSAGLLFRFFTQAQQRVNSTYCDTKILMSISAQSNVVEPTTEQPPEFTVDLRPYQRRAIEWMLKRELRPKQIRNSLWSEARTLDGRAYYHLAYSDGFSMQKPQLIDGVCGGILADEMGLGKTVEMIGCILSNPFKQAESSFKIPRYNISGQAAQVQPVMHEHSIPLQCLCGNSVVAQPLLCCNCRVKVQHAVCTDFHGPDNEFVCTDCMQVSNVPVRGTLIISPRIIKDQWIAEIDKHTREGALRVLDYRGIRDGEFIRPERLDDYDIVMTTYEVLKHEVHHVQSDSSSRSTRTRKRYEVAPTPLTQVLWWRICLDEAQLVEGSTTKAADMASRLNAVNRWCVSGTPFSRGFEDLYGLLYFLRASPFDSKKLWDLTMNEPIVNSDTNTAEVIGFIADLMWRNTKAQVSSELQIPRQHQNRLTVRLDAIARYHYQRLHEECTENVTSAIKKWCGHETRDTPLMELHASTTKALLAPLLRLRQACDHPLAAKGNVLAANGGKAPKTMKDVAVQMINKVKTTCLDHLRSVILAWNGIAALAQLESLKFISGGSKEKVDQEYIALGPICHNVSGIPADSWPTDITIWRIAVSKACERFPDYPSKLGIEYAAAYYKGKAGAWESAETIYERVLDRFDSYSRDKHEYMIDHMQLMHAIENLSLLLKRRLKEEKFSDSVSNDLSKRINDLGARAMIVRQRYTNECENEVTNYELSFECTSQPIKFSTHDWVFSMIEFFKACGDEFDIVQKVKDDLGVAGPNDASATVHSQVQTVTSMAGLGIILNRHLQRVQETRQLLQEHMSRLRKHPTDAEIQVQASCPNCRFERQSKVSINPKACIYCDTEQIQIQYETMIFSQSSIASGEKVRKVVTNDTGKGKHKALKDLESDFFYLKRKGENTKVALQGPSATERILRILGSIYKRRNNSPGDLQAMKLFFDHIDALKKEFLAGRTLWMMLWSRVSKLDELAMCAQRVQIRRHNQKVSEEEKHAFLLPSEYYDRLLMFQSWNSEFGHKLKRSWGQLTYLRNLENQKKGVALDCPICTAQLGAEYLVFGCGHSYCVDCVSIMVKRNVDKQSFRCALCRAVSTKDDIERVNIGVTENSKAEDHSSFDIEGDHSPKINAVVRCLKELQEDDYAAKSIVFSMWSSVLGLIEEALGENGIRCVKLSGPPAKDQICLQKFKEDPQIGVLLMPITKGAQGLNLTEATHVILVEPILDGGMEAQAIGRVHRMGQKYETHVHRFVTDGTVEEAIRRYDSQSLLNPAQSPTHRKREGNDAEKLTLRALESMFDSRVDVLSFPKSTPTEYSKNATPASLPNEDEASVLVTKSDLKKAFWSGVCGYRESAVSRDVICRRMMVAHSFTDMGSDSLYYDLFGKEIPINVAEQLLKQVSVNIHESKELRMAIEGHSKTVGELIEQEVLDGLVP